MKLKGSDGGLEQQWNRFFEAKVTSWWYMAVYRECLKIFRSESHPKTSWYVSWVQNDVNHTLILLMLYP